MKAKHYHHHLLLITTVCYSLMVIALGWQSLPGLQPTPPHPAPPVATAPSRIAGTSGTGINATLASSTTHQTTTDQPSSAPLSSDNPANINYEKAYGLPTYPHPEYQYHALMSAPTGTLYSENASVLSRLSASTAWSNFNNTNSAPVIAMVDTGFALDHQALVSRWDGVQGTSSWLGWNFVDNNNDPMAGATDPNGTAVFHGTMTAGLASMLNPNAELLPLQALSDEGSGTTDEVAAAIRYAADNGANIISLSLGSSSDDSYLQQQIDYALGKGVTVVAAAGNDGCNCMDYPAAYPGVLSVGASTSNDTTASFSNYGSGLDVLAPGTAGDVCSTFYSPSNPTSGYTCDYSGTSFSTPIVSGLASLLLQQYPGLSPTAVVSIIEQTADKVPEMDGQNQTLTAGYGRVDVAAALAAVTLPGPNGQLANKDYYSLSSSNPITDPTGESTCTGTPGTTCTLVLTGPSGQMINLGNQTIDSNGGTEFIWDASTLDLAPGQWTVTAYWFDNGQEASSSAPETITISP